MSEPGMIRFDRIKQVEFYEQWQKERADIEAAYAKQDEEDAETNESGTVERETLLQSAVDAVLAVHTPDDEGDCTYCADYFCDTRKAEYPCETVRTIHAALKGVGDE